MKYKSKMTMSLVALSVVSNLSFANTLFTPLKKFEVSEKSSPISDFAKWREKVKNQRNADTTDRFIVTLKSSKQLPSTMEYLHSENNITNSLAYRRIENSLSKNAGIELKAIKRINSNTLIMSMPTLMDNKLALAKAHLLNQNALVADVEPDPRRYPMAENQPWGLSAVQADLVSDNESGNTTVCIIDSGYDITNPDLSGNQVDGTNDSGTGSWSTPGGSHGSHVAGTIAAINNNEGVVGVLPNQKVNLHIIKVFNESGYAYSSDLVSAVGKCKDAGANIVNMSLGGASSSATERNGMQSFYNDGILLVAAAGNDGNSELSYPASYDSVISVAAVDETGSHAEFSQFTSQVELSGPGEAILSTVGIGDGRQGYITYNGVILGDDDVLPPTRFVDNGSGFVTSDINGTVTGDLAACTRTGSNYSCGDMAGKICIAERHANQVGSNFPEIDPAKACADAGATGVIVYSNSERPGLQNPFLVDASSLVTVPVVSVNRGNGQQLVNAVGQATTLQVAGNTNYAYYNGTSMATPHVSGVAALAWSKNPSCTAAQVRQALTTTALDLDTSGRDIRTGFGMVQTKAASDYMTTLCSSGGNSGQPSQTALANGSPVANMAANTGSELVYTLDVPTGAKDLSFNLSSGTGDADLYVSFANEPTTRVYDCRSWNSGNTESCSFATPSAGTYYVKLVAYASFSGANLIANYTEAPSGNTPTGDTAQVADISATRNNWQRYTWDVPAGMSILTFKTIGGTGDADLYIRQGSQPTTSTYSCRSWESGNAELCTINNPAAGTWHIGIHAYRAFNGITLDAEYKP